jgi:glycosyltransferase involved in cell wall biosynthesis
MDGVSIVVPTLGRSTLDRLVEALSAQLHTATQPVEIIVVRDEARRGPAAARNQGWRAAQYPWIAFLDDDVVPDPDWLALLGKDLSQPGQVGGVQGRLRVPLPADRPPDDWEACTAGLARARWTTADMAYRRAALLSVGGFDERFPRAYREDAELAFRVAREGWRLVRGDRVCAHPVRPEGPWVSLRTQRGNADDALLRRLYGRRWRQLLGIPTGRRSRHVLVVGAGLAALALAGTGRRRAAGWAAGAWLAGTAEFAIARAAAAPGALRRPLPLLATSVAIPPLAVAHWLSGWYRHRRNTPPRL